MPASAAGTCPEEPAEPLPADPLPFDPPDDAEPPPEPEQLPITDGWQAKPSPQSASALHGNCHLNAHADGPWTVVQTGSFVVGVGQSAPGAQGGTAEPPEHSVDVSA
ncbi:MAG TPA: hypothetical protein VH374_18245 [Polyangia bacterium]|nr:hypothetical protein [Polyangia bacterium]